MSTLYLMFVNGGELAGLERGAPANIGAARREALHLLTRDRDVRAVEIWSAGLLIEAVHG